MPRKSTSISLDADLIARAKRVGVNLSRAAEAGIEQDVRKAEAERWKEENKDAIQAYNKRVEAEGLPLDAYRKW
ncbi:type II toxin-antitoxin system CcdA family antitoxin [Marivita hallyeonensis]|uniref:Antitoxin CcdA n=1 Tax=Marivita hallyeonensis TaxID=996342 RepID=A0A1M5PFV5_9RHOB|nr:type II toxin-antitoxin system CcdA family antitoxin [Marivita hallyeonensis]SHH00133.1 antitoxin CcdA [Marivita hallyeonensis]